MAGVTLPVGCRAIAEDTYTQGTPGNLHVSVRMSGHSVPELEIEQTVYGVVARHRGLISAEHGIESLKRAFFCQCRAAPRKLR
jgi:hypothetical protein